MQEMELIKAAIQVRTRAHAPYSGFAVGAALLTKSGAVFTGCNIENISYRMTMCAEQGAVAAAIAEGQREFVSIAVVADSARPIVPCGACRQVLAEFNPDMTVVMATTGGQHEALPLSQLLPRPTEGILETTSDV